MGDGSILSGRRGGRRASAGARSRGGSPRRGAGRTPCGSRRETRRGRRRGPIPRTPCRRSGTIPQQCIAPGEGTKSRRRRESQQRAASIVARPPPGSSTGLNAPPRRRRGRRRPPRALRHIVLESWPSWPRKVPAPGVTAEEYHCRRFMSGRTGGRHAGGSYRDVGNRVVRGRKRRPLPRGLYE